MDFFWVANQNGRKAIDDVRVILNKIYLVYGKFTASFLLIYSWHLTILGPCYFKTKKKQIDVTFYASVLLLMINFVINIVKYIAKPLACV